MFRGHFFHFIKFLCFCGRERRRGEEKIRRNGRISNTHTEQRQEKKERKKERTKHREEEEQEKVRASGAKQNTNLSFWHPIRESDCISVADWQGCLPYCGETAPSIHDILCFSI
jgi:hypothetical protein